MKARNMRKKRSRRKNDHQEQTRQRGLCQNNHVGHRDTDSYTTASTQTLATGFVPPMHTNRIGNSYNELAMRTCKRGARGGSCCWVQGSRRKSCRKASSHTEASQGHFAHKLARIGY